MIQITLDIIICDKKVSKVLQKLPHCVNFAIFHEKNAHRYIVKKKIFENNFHKFANLFRPS
jgi:hypothetical protein